MSFVLAGAVLRGPGPLPRARSGRGKRWQARHTRRLCWQARYLEALDLCRARARARAAGNAGRRDTRVVSAGRRGTWRPWTFAARGRRDTRVVCAGRRGTYIEALDLCRARARAAGNAGRRDTRAARALGPRETLTGATHVSFVLAGAVLRGPGPLPRARSGRGKRWQARHTRRLCWQARYLEALDLCRARARAAGNAGRRDTRVCWQARYLEALDLCRARARAAGNAGRRDTCVVCAGRRGT